MSMKETNKCPVCGATELGYMDICTNCEWQNDYVQLHHPDMAGGANQMSLDEARKAYAEGKPVQ